MERQKKILIWNYISEDYLDGVNARRNCTKQNEKDK